MIQVTLTFPSLSAAIKALREIPENTIAGALTDITPAPVEEPVPAPKPEKARREKPAAPALAVVPPPTTVEPAAPQAPAAAPAIEYPQLQKVVLQLAGRDRDAATRIAADFGVRTFKELPAERWAEAYGAVTAKLAELEQP